MELTVNAKPMSFLKVLKFDTKDLIHVYKGKLDNCRCGCGGDYFKPGEDDAEVQRALDLLLKYASRGEVLFEEFSYKDSAKNELYFEFETHTTSNYDNGFDEDEDDDYGWYEEVRMGYGIYIKNIKE